MSMEVHERYGPIIGPVWPEPNKPGINLTNQAIVYLKWIEKAETFRKPRRKRK